MMGESVMHYTPTRIKRVCGSFVGVMSSVGTKKLRKEE